MENALRRPELPESQSHFICIDAAASSPRRRRIAIKLNR
jgi:hypothetical protein